MARGPVCDVKWVLLRKTNEDQGTPLYFLNDKREEKDGATVLLMRPSDEPRTPPTPSSPESVGTIGAEDNAFYLVGGACGKASTHLKK